MGGADPTTIVVPLDGSPFAERALPVAGALAERLDAGLVLVTAPWEEDSNAASDYLEQIAAETQLRAVDDLAVERARQIDGSDIAHA